jgi:hypothetical protein
VVADDEAAAAAAAAADEEVAGFGLPIGEAEFIEGWFELVDIVFGLRVAEGAGVEDAEAVVPLVLLVTGD